MPAQRLININGSGGAFVDISATLHCRYAEAIEDDSGAAQGLDYQTGEDNFAATYDVSATNQPIKLGNQVGVMGSGNAPVIGRPIQVGPGLAATKLISIRSKTATATKVRFREHE